MDFGRRCEYVDGGELFAGISAASFDCDANSDHVMHVEGGNQGSRCDYLCWRYGVVHRIYRGCLGRRGRWVVIR